jgi:fructose-1,6-bisphosphatase/inositol monophosphatase family enzyme
LVAAGGLAASFCKQSKIWDIAAGVLLVEEAGGLVTDPFGADVLPFETPPGTGDIPLLVATPSAHRRLADSISDLAPA